MAVKQKRIKCARCGERDTVTRGERGPVSIYCDLCRDEVKRYVEKHRPRRTASAGAFPRSAAAKPDSLRVLFAAAHTNPTPRRRTQVLRERQRARNRSELRSYGRLLNGPAYPELGYSQHLTTWKKNRRRAAPARGCRANSTHYGFCSLALANPALDERAIA